MEKKPKGKSMSKGLKAMRAAKGGGMPKPKTKRKGKS